MGAVERMGCRPGLGESEEVFGGGGVLKKKEDEREPADDHRVGRKTFRGELMACRAEARKERGGKGAGTEGGVRAEEAQGQGTWLSSRSGGDRRGRSGARAPGGRGLHLGESHGRPAEQQGDSEASSSAVVGGR